MVQNLRRVPLLSEFCPPPEELRGGQKNFARFVFPPEQNPVSAPVYVYCISMQYTLFKDLLFPIFSLCCLHAI